ncbi:G2/mitotic-specific cyclin-1-like [Herrania umbratica]|uniref:G2/mitotic-specific cyclin-1-like n=1 Tax=Herrania umbratica TaxID=108875 RepID=A0A6J0ZKI2_9ROSI|nr:G2/mitotic-specific cyclin-1-like [Herrania umbratica]
MDHISDENNHPNFVKPTNFQEGGAVMGSRKFGQEIRHNRRALSVINQNLVGARAYPCVVNKRGLSERNENFENNQLDPVHRPITRLQRQFGVTQIAAQRVVSLSLTLLEGLAFVL